MTRTLLGFSLLALVAAAGFTASTMTLTAQTAATESIQQGCDIPKSYGRLVSVLAGAPGGPGAGTTYAIFEAEDGAIRWVAAAATGSVLNTQTPPRGQVLPAFIQRYECILGSEWKRH